MRKVLFVLVVLSLLVAACGPGVGDEAYKIAFLLADARGDGGWNSAHYRGIEQLKSLGEVVEEEYSSFTVKTKDGLLKVLIVENVGYNEVDIERVVNGVVNEDYDMIWGTWWDSQNAIYNAAEKNPNILFEHCSSYPFKENNGSNFSTYFIRQEEGDYVAGCVAGLIGITSVGFVGTHPIPEPIRGLNAFALGLQQCGSEDAEVQVVWLNSWLDVEGERLAAEALLGEGTIKCWETNSQPYTNARFSAGLVEGAEPDTVYFRQDKDGEEPLIILLRLDEMEAVVYVCSCALWSHAVIEDEDRSR